jgi:hypothetical protein
MCVLTVASETTSVVAISSLDWPRATRVRTSPFAFGQLPDGRRHTGQWRWSANVLLDQPSGQIPSMTGIRTSMSTTAGKPLCGDENQAVWPGVVCRHRVDQELASVCRGCLHQDS